MSRKTKSKAPPPNQDIDNEPSSSSPHNNDNNDNDNNTTTEEDLTQTTPPEINPYKILSLPQTATSSEIKSAYHKAALKHHPDKSSPQDRPAAHKKFQEIAFAYAILSDEKRRRRYDVTGNTAETLHDDDEDFNWVDFFREQSAAMVDGDMIEKIKTEYQGSEEERGDVLRAYTEYEGDMDMVFESVMCSDVLEDEDRFRGIIDAAIKDGEVEEFERYTGETKKSRVKRRKRAKVEEAEAMELAEELGVREKLFGGGGGDKENVEKGSKKGKGKKENGDDALRALIQQRQRGRAENFFDDLEAKYGGGSKSSKRKIEEPPEEMFRKNAKKSKDKAR